MMSARPLTVVLVFLVVAQQLACASASSSPASADPDAGTTSAPDGGAADAAVRPPATFLDPSDHAKWLVIDAKFPFAVTARHATTSSVTGARWGRHGAPMLTTEVYKAGPTAPGVIRWTIPADPTRDATMKETAFAEATGLPAQVFYGADGVVDLPFGSLELLSYTSSGAAFPGEALLYSPDLQEVTSRAKVNGFYSGVGISTPAGGRILYSGLSPLSAATSATNENGLYAADVCDASLLPTGACTPAVRLLQWKGASGPVIADAHDNVFVAASLSAGATSDAVYGLARAQALASTQLSPAALADADTGGTSSLAAIAPDGDGLGYVLAKGFDSPGAQRAFAQAYAEGPDALAKSGARIDGALLPGPDAESFSMFTDADGDLWVAVSLAKGGVFLELRRK